VADHQVDLVGVRVPAEPTVRSTEIRLEYRGQLGGERRARRLPEVDLHPLREAGVFVERRSCGERQHVGRRVEDRGMIEEHAQCDMLRILPPFASRCAGLGGDREPEPCRLGQDEPQPLGVAEFGDAVEIGHEARRIAFLRAGEERRERVSGRLRRRAQGVDVEAEQSVPMPVEQSGDQCRIDGSQELRVDEFPEVAGHGVLPGHVDVHDMFLSRHSTCGRVAICM
jgi:hypothetical protein